MERSHRRSIFYGHVESGSTSSTCVIPTYASAARNHSRSWSRLKPFSPLRTIIHNQFSEGPFLCSLRFHVSSVSPLLCPRTGSRIYWDPTDKIQILPGEQGAQRFCLTLRRSCVLLDLGDERCPIRSSCLNRWGRLGSLA